MKNSPNLRQVYMPSGDYVRIRKIEACNDSSMNLPDCKEKAK